jgi:hypothetical protein
MRIAVFVYSENVRHRIRAAQNRRRNRRKTGAETGAETGAKILTLEYLTVS